MLRIIVLTAILLLLSSGGGCSADKPLNPSFPLTLAEARLAMQSMADNPAPLERPVVVLAGIIDPGVVVAGLTRRIRSVTSEKDRVISVAFAGARDFDDCRDRVLRAVERAFPNGGLPQTVEVDVIGYSMGGLVARYAAMPHEDDERILTIRRLFTISTPHRGASMAFLPTLDPKTVSMRPGSAFLEELDAFSPVRPYELLCYVRLDDTVVGEANAAPPGRTAWWVANMPLDLAHLGAGEDPRIVADIARRLRNEPAYTRAPPAPLPGKSPADGSAP